MEICQRHKLKSFSSSKELLLTLVSRQLYPSSQPSQSRDKTSLDYLNLHFEPCIST